MGEAITPALFAHPAPADPAARLAREVGAGLGDESYLEEPSWIFPPQLLMSLKGSCQIIFFLMGRAGCRKRKEERFGLGFSWWRNLTWGRAAWLQAGKWQHSIVAKYNTFVQGHLPFGIFVEVNVPRCCQRFWNGPQLPVGSDSVCFKVGCGGR